MASPPLSFGELYSVVVLGFVSVLLRDPWRVGECSLLLSGQLCHFIGILGGCIFFCCVYMILVCW